MSQERRVVRVDTPARLQMGLLDLRGDLGRLFGGVGVAIEEPRTKLELELAHELTAEGPDASRAAGAARLFLEHHGLPQGATIRVLRAIPPHVGLGSGTQLALAVAKGLSELHALPTHVTSLAPAATRGARSAVGSWTFAGGGLVVEGGVRVDGVAVGEHRRLAPLIGRYSMPHAWRCVVALPEAPSGLSGEDEGAAFERLPPPAAELVGRITRVVLMGVLPALLEEDLDGFGRGISELQRLVGECFAPVQGSVFAAPEVAETISRMKDLGARGVGQSSWGPAVYGFVDEESAAARLTAGVGKWLDGRGRVFATRFDNYGARVSYAESGWSCDTVATHAGSGP